MRHGGNREFISMVNLAVRQSLLKLSDAFIGDKTAKQLQRPEFSQALEVLQTRIGDPASTKTYPLKLAQTFQRH